MNELARAEASLDWLPDDDFPGFQEWLFHRPEQVVADPSLTVEDKRALLAFWASDIHAVPDAPALRRLENGSTIEIDAILQALKSLDTACMPRTIAG